PFDIVHADCLREPTYCRWRVDAVRNVDGQQTFPDREPVHSPDSDNRPRGRWRGQRWMLALAGPEVGQESADERRVDRFEGRHAAQVEVLLVTAKVAPVGQQSIGGNAALDRQMIEIAGDYAGRSERTAAQRGDRPGRGHDAARPGSPSQGASVGRNGRHSASRASTVAQMPATAAALVI